MWNLSTIFYKVLIIAIATLSSSVAMCFSEAWLKGLQYQKSLSGYKSIVDEPSYFLHPQGKTSPQDELTATLNYFAQAPLEAACRFPFRRQLLIKYFSQSYAECPKHQHWKQTLDAEYVSIIFAAGFLSNPSSMFGHTFFKIHSRKNGDDKTELDYGVNFSAITGDEPTATYAIKGVTGQFPGAWSMIPYHLKLKEYGGMEGRDLFEFKLSLSPSEVEMLIDYFIEIEKAYTDYYFFDDNCSRALLVALEAVRPKSQLTDAFIYAVLPSDTIKVVAKNNLISQELYTPSGKTKFAVLQDSATVPQKFAVAQALRQHKFETLKSEVELDLALEYYNLEALKNEASVDPDIFFNLKKQRAKVLSSQKISVPTLPSPLQGHGSSLLGIGYGHQQNSKSAMAHLRGGYHSLAQLSHGYLAGAEIIFLDAYLKFKPAGVFAESLTWLKIISLNPVDLFYQPISWGLQFDTDFNQQQHSFDGLLGYTIQWNQLKIAAMAQLMVANQIYLAPAALLNWQFFDMWSGYSQFVQSPSGLKNKTGMSFAHPGSSYALSIENINLNNVNSTYLELSFTY